MCVDDEKASLCGVMGRSVTSAIRVFDAKLQQLFGVTNCNVSTVCLLSNVFVQLKFSVASRPRHYRIVQFLRCPYICCIGPYVGPIGPISVYVKCLMNMLRCES